MNELALFAGAGGGLLGTHWFLGWRCVGYVEMAEYPCKVIEARINDGYLSPAPIFNMHTRQFIDGGWAEKYRGLVDVVSAGFPCQPFSVSGNQLGEDDARNGWPDTIDIIRLVRPKFVFLENVPGIISSGYLSVVLSDLAESGYDARWRILSAAELGAPHLRKRWWCVAYAKGERLPKERFSVRRPAQWPGWSGAVAVADRERCAEMEPSDGGGERGTGASGPAVSPGEYLANSGRSRCDAQNAGEPLSDIERQLEAPEQRGGAIEGLALSSGAKVPDPDQKRLEDGGPELGSRDVAGQDWWAIEPRLGRVAHGVADRVDRLEAIGNGQVPNVAAKAWQLLTTEIEEM